MTNITNPESRIPLFLNRKRRGQDETNYATVIHRSRLSDPFFLFVFFFFFIYFHLFLLATAQVSDHLAIVMLVVYTMATIPITIMAMSPNFSHGRLATPL